MRSLLAYIQQPADILGSHVNGTTTREMIGELANEENTNWKGLILGACVRH
jgi:hypothetical protein